MGGEDTGCTEDTRHVFVESAWFDPQRIAASGRKLGIQSDARYRFERGTDPAFVVPGLELATKLVLEFCGGEPAERVMAGAGPPRRTQNAFLSEKGRGAAGRLPAAKLRFGKFCSP